MKIWKEWKIWGATGLAACSLVKLAPRYVRAAGNKQLLILEERGINKERREGGVGYRELLEILIGLEGLLGAGGR